MTIKYILASITILLVLVGQTINAAENEGSGVTDNIIELSQSVHFSTPTREPVVVASGKYRVKKGGASSLVLIGEDGSSIKISATPNEHDETLANQESLVVGAGENSTSIVLLETDGTSLEAFGTFSGVETRGTLPRLSKTQVSTAYNVRLNARIKSVQTIQEQSQTYEGTTPQVATSWEEKFEQERAGLITSAMLRNAIAKTFAGSTLKANSCGGSYTYRKSNINIPSVPFYREEFGLDRLHYDLTNGEREKSQYHYVVGTRHRKEGRRYSIRACVKDWDASNPADWQGGVVNGELQVQLNFGISVIETRALEYQNNGLWWEKRWEWADAGSQRIIPDLMNSPVLIVRLRPGLNNGRLTLATVNVRWDNRIDAFSSDGVFRLSPMEANKIKDYQLRSFNELLTRFSTIFNDGAVRNSLANNLTEILLANSFVHKLTGITGPSSDGAVITMSYE